jgi:hypothetical protein
MAKNNFFGGVFLISLSVTFFSVGGTEAGIGVGIAGLFFMAFGVASFLRR